VLDAVADHPALANYHLSLSVRGDLLERLGRFAEAEAVFRKAAAITGNEREQLLLYARADEAASRL
jgi:predicted RNA polymerase sigma factor